MKENSRTRNAVLNITFGYLAQLGILVLSFIGRKIFLYYLSADYLGINGLYSNILTILSLAELGLDTAVVYSLYKPVANHDNILIASLLKYFKKIYSFLAIGIFIVGISIIPALKYLINSDLPEKNLIFYYLLFLINTICSYFVAHKIALLSASQQQRIQKIVSLSTNIILQIVHIVVLLIWKNYYVYIIATVCSTILTNCILSIVCTKIHPEIFDCKETVPIDKKPIINRVLSTFLYKLGGVAINSTDNILISVLVSTAAVGFYSNYFTVVSSIQGFLAIITTSMIAGIGNLAAKGTEQEQSSLFDMMVFFYHEVAALGFIGFSILFNNFITLWLGDEYLFNELTVFIIALNFYLSNAISPVWMFREANGLFGKVKYLLLIRAAINVVLSVVFGKIWGVFGIFLATAISLIFVNFWYEPKLLSDIVLKRPQKVYWFKQGKYFMITIVAFIICYFTTKQMSSSFLFFIVKTITVIIFTLGMFIGLNYKTPEFSKMKDYVKRIISK